MLKITETISKDIKMECRINKCEVVYMEKRKWQKEREIKSLNSEIVMKQKRKWNIQISKISTDQRTTEEYR